MFVSLDFTHTLPAYVKFFISQYPKPFFSSHLCLSSQYIKLPWLLKYDRYCFNCYKYYMINTILIDKNAEQHQSWPLGSSLGLHLYIQLLTTTFCLLPSNQFLSHWTVHPSSLYLSNLHIRKWCGIIISIFFLFFLYRKAPPYLLIHISH